MPDTTTAPAVTTAPVTQAAPTAPAAPAAATSPEALHDAAIAATEAWQATPTPELKTAAQEAVKAAKEAWKAPEKYALTMPKDAVLPADEMAKVESFAKANGLTQKQAQACLESRNETVKQVFDSQKADQEAQKARWLKEAMEDPEIGGENLKETSENIKRLFEKNPSKEIETFLKDTGFGSHPIVMKWFNRFAKSAADDKIVIPGGGGGEKKEVSRKEAFYGPPKT